MNLINKQLKLQSFCKSGCHFYVFLFLLVNLNIAIGTHSLRYYYTAMSGVSDFPEFTVVGLIDEGQFIYFDSKTKEAVPKTDWMKQNVGADYWNRQTQIFTGGHQSFKVDIQTLKGRFNHSTGVHTYQVMYGCELQDDGTKRGYEQHGYDGGDFISLDTNSFTWTAANPQAMMTKNKWDSTGAYAMKQKAYLQNTCIEWLQKYVGYGKDTLEKKVSPQVSLLKKSSSSQVVCHTTGFYPKEVTISWQKNGQDHYENVNLGELLPNEDGTFQKMSTITVTADERKNNKYSCVVEHQGKTMEEILTEGKNSLPIGIIVGGVVAAVLVLVVIAVVVFKVLQK
uniref:BOLA class I histocompatibility antigen, alpha chain BL3-7-like n=1 Tax=Sinocyclocheilus rhinocerous TaxID=307959 RepID=A0A673LN40_9TELE